jgi:hypothetical protein
LIVNIDIPVRGQSVWWNNRDATIVVVAAFVFRILSFLGVVN